MIPDVVSKACAELSAAADVFVFYSPLCRTPSRRAVEAVETLLEGADASSFFKTVDWDAFPVPPAVRRLAGERPSWRRAVAAAFFSAFFSDAHSEEAGRGGGLRAVCMG